MNRPIFFQAAHLNDQESIDQFIVRQYELDRLLAEIRRDDMSGSIQHYVLIGQRGSGKSTLLRRVQAAVHTEPALSDRLVAVNLSEEQAGIYRLHDLWHRVSEELRELGYPVEEVDWSHFDDDRVALARAGYAAMQHALREANKKLVLLLDNIDRIFKNLDKAEAHLFRELLINHSDVRIIGGSTLLSEHHWKYDQPFYEFFQMISLAPLGSAEMRALLVAWAERLQLPALRAFAESGDGRLEALRILSDGMPRTMLQLVDLITQRPDQDSYDYLLYIVDKASAIYQERLGLLSPHQQKVLLELSFFWEATTAGQLKEAARMDVKPLSAALNKLTEMGYVETIPGKGKHHLYRVKERFFNLWLIMTQGGPKQRRRVKYLTVFLEIWYGRDGLIRYAADYRERLKQGGVDAGHAALMTQALTRSAHLSVDDRDALIESTRPLVSARKELADHLPPTSSEACQKARDLLLQKNYKEALAELDELEQDTSEKYILHGWAQGGLGRVEQCVELVERGVELDSSGSTLNKAGYVLHLIKDHARAEAQYLRAIDKGDIFALYNLAILYSEIGKPEQAEAYYLRAIDKGDVDALNNLALLYQKTAKPEQAEAFYLRAIDKGDVNALYNLANLYQKTAKPEQAEAFYLRAIDKGHVNALHNLAILYQETAKPEQAEAYYLRAIDKGDVNALYNLARLYQETAKPEQAEAYYLRAIDKGHVGALNDLAIFYAWSGSPEQAENYLLRAVDKGNVNALHHLALLDYVRCQPPRRALGLLERLKATEGAFDIGAQSLETVLLTWAGRPEEAQPIADTLSGLLQPEADANASLWVREFLVHFRTNEVWACFTSEELGNTLKEQLQPLYFATANLVGKAGEDAVRVMPTELASTVEDILKDIAEERVRYYPPSK
jgi:TPR repeat protein/energy-coupling factor transporter ATP-binding protein EcfA2